jgi:hypothetical protein
MYNAIAYLCDGKLQYDAENIGAQCQIETAFARAMGRAPFVSKFTLSLDFPAEKLLQGY